MSAPKSKKAPAKVKAMSKPAHQSSIDLRVIVILLTIIVTVVFLWGYINRSAEPSNAASPSGERTIITRPGENK